MMMTVMTRRRTRDSSKEAITQEICPSPKTIRDGQIITAHHILVHYLLNILPWYFCRDNSKIIPRMPQEMISPAPTVRQ